MLPASRFLLAALFPLPEYQTVVWPELRYSLSPLVAVASVFTLVLTALACLLVELALLTVSNAATKVKPGTTVVSARGISGEWNPTMTGTA